MRGIRQNKKLYNKCFLAVIVKCLESLIKTSSSLFLLGDPLKRRDVYL